MQDTLRQITGVEQVEEYGTMDKYKLSIDPEKMTSTQYILIFKFGYSIINADFEIDMLYICNTNILSSEYNMNTHITGMGDSNV